jgi:hypothetical protein
VEPVAAQARLMVCTENGFSLPKVFADFTIEEIEALLSRQQVFSLHPFIVAILTDMIQCVLLNL